MNWIVRMLFGEESEKEAEEMDQMTTHDPDGDIWDDQLPTTGEDPAIQLSESHPDPPDDKGGGGLLGWLLGR